MNIGNIDGVQVFVTPEGYEELKKQKLIEENEILQDLQERIDNAIEEIYYLIGNCDISDYQGQKLIQILQGEDNGKDN